MKQRFNLYSLSLLALIITSCASHQDKVMKDGDIQPTLSETLKEKINQESLDQHVAKWPGPSKDALSQMVKAHGMPHGISSDSIVWNDVKPFKRIVVYKEASSHLNHDDVLEHVITYDAPSETQRMSMLKLNESLTISSLHHEMSVRCHHEKANILSLNLAHEIGQGKMTLNAAKQKLLTHLQRPNQKPDLYSESIIFGKESKKISAR